MVVLKQRSSAAGGLPGAESGRGSPRSAAEASASDGLVGVYAARAAGRGVDLRPIINRHRERIDGRVGRLPTRQLPPVPVGTFAARPVGRGTAAHRLAIRQTRGAAACRPEGLSTVRPSAQADSDHLRVRRGLDPTRWIAIGRRARGDRRRLITAGLAAMLLLGGAGGLAGAQEPPVQQRYRAQPGDSLDDLADAFGVDPAAILAASGLTDPPTLSPTEIVVIPAPDQSPDEAARMAAQLEGTSPFVLDAHVVEAGETVATIAGIYGVTAQAIAAFNGLDEPDVLGVGQRLLIPAPPGLGGAAPAAPGAEPAGSAPALDNTVPDERNGDGSLPPAVSIPGVPTYVQQRNLSCEYAAAYIVTSAFGAGVPESDFIASVPQARNPHAGYRGNIDGPWGNTDDYGVYPEALVPTLEANGFAADVFYTAGDPEPLRQRIAAGRPVAAWLGLWGDTAVTLDDDGVYTVAAGAHVVVVYGYDEGGVHVSNPANGAYDYYAWDDFIAKWSVLDGMSLAVSPR